MNLITPTKKIHFVLLLMIGCMSFQFSGVENQYNTMMSLSEKILSPELENSSWSDLVSHEGVSISYKLIQDNECEKFILRINNESNQNKEIKFGVAGIIRNQPCREMYSSISEYNVRKIEVEAFNEVIGDENTPNLVILKTNDYEPIEVLIQNLQIRTI